MFWSKVETVGGVSVGYVTVMEAGTMLDEATKAAQKLASKQEVVIKKM